MALTAEQYAAYAADPDTVALGNYLGGPPAAAPQPAAQPDYAVQPTTPAPQAAPHTIYDGVDTTSYGTVNPDLVSYYAGHQSEAPSEDAFLANHYRTRGVNEIAEGTRNAGEYEVAPPRVKNGIAVNYGTPEGGALAPKAAEANPPAITAPSTNSVNGVPLPYNVPIDQPLPNGLREPDLMPAGGQYGTSYYAAKTDDGDFAGAVMAAPDQKIRLIDGKTGQVVYEGVGPEAARIATATANNLSTGAGSDKAAWAIQGDAGNGQWVTQAQDMVDTKHPTLLSSLADIALPIIGAILLGPAGAALGSGLSSAVQGRSLEDGALRAVLSAAGAWAAPGIGNAVGSALGSTGASVAASGVGNLVGNAGADVLANAATNAAVQALGNTVSEVVITAAQSIVPQLVAQGVSQAGINAVVNQIAQNVDNGRPATEGISQPNTVDTVDVTSPGASSGGAGALGAGAGAGAGNLIDGITVTPEQGGINSHTIQDAGGIVGNLISTPADITGPTLDATDNYAAGVPTAAVAATPVLTSTPADIGTPSNGIDPRLLTVVKNLLPLVAGGLAGGGGSYQIPTAGGAGTRASLDPIFSAGLPAATRGGRTQLNPQVDWSRYAIQGPEKSFFSNVTQNAQDFTVPSRNDALLSGVGDVNGDGVINDADIALFRKRFGAQAFAKGGAVEGALNALNSAGGQALNRAEWFVDKLPDRLARGVDAVREKLHVEPPISNYPLTRLDDKAYSVETPNIGGYTLQHYDPRTLPEEFDLGEGSIFHGKRVVGKPVEYGGDRGERKPEHIVESYRADPTNRFGGGKGLETMPTKFRGAELYSAARDMAAAAHLGVPQLTAQQLATLALKEGREDFGTNGSGDAATSTLVKKLTDAGVPFDNATFMAQLKIKQDTAERLGIPFETAWNGTGKNKFGQSGRDYANDAKTQSKAAMTPANKRLLAIIQRGIDDGSKYPVPDPEVSRAPIRAGFAKGGAPKRSEYAVKGDGDGRSDSIPAVLSDGEYIIDAETVALLGNGSSQAGAKALDKFRVNVRKHKGKQLAKGRFSANAKQPHAYFAGGRT